MSCDAVAFAATLWLASTSAAPAAGDAAADARPPPSVASEPLFVGIVQPRRQAEGRDRGL